MLWTELQAAGVVRRIGLLLTLLIANTPVEARSRYSHPGMVWIELRSLRLRITQPFAHHPVVIEPSPYRLSK